MTSDRLSQRIALAAAGAAGVIAVLGAVGHAAGIQLLPYYPPGAPQMTVPTTAAAALVTLGLLALALAPRHRIARAGAAATGALALAVAVLALTVHVPAERSVAAAVVGCAGSALLLLAVGRARSVAGALALVVVVVAFVVCLGFLYRGPLFVSRPWRPITLMAGIAGLLLGSGLVAAAGPTAWPLRQLCGDSVQAVLLRWFLPFVVLAILVTDVAEVNLFSRFSQAAGSVVNSLVTAGAAVIVSYYLARIIGARIDRAEQATIRLSRLNSVLSRTNELITRGTDQQTLFEEACRISVDGGFDMAWVGTVDPDTRRVRRVASYGNVGSYLDEVRISIDDVPEGRGPTGTALRDGVPFVCRNIARDPRMGPWRKLALAMGFHSSAAFPLRTLDQVTHAYMVYAREPGWFADDQVKLLGELAADLSYALGALEKERRRSEAERELAASEVRFRALIENSSDLITITDQAGAIQYQSPSVGRLLGYDKTERLGRSIYDLIHPDDVVAVRDAMLRGLETGGVVDPIVCRLRHKSGSWRVLESVGWNMLSVSGVAGLVIHSRDVTDRRALEAQLRQAQKMEAVGQLAGGIAHDFNNVLSVIMANAGLVAGTLPADANDARQELRDVQDAAKRGKVMVQELMGVSRVAEIEMRPRNLGEIADGVARMLGRILPATVTVNVNVDSDLPAALVDQGAVEQMLLNLATNARDAMPDGGTLGISVVRAEPDERSPDTPKGGRAAEYLCVAVSDTGIGMDEETVQRVFEPFFTTKPRGVGTGLGMAMVQGLMSQHGGFVRVNSALGEGTTVGLCFPVAEAEAAEPAAAPAVVPAQAADVHGTETVLVVDDDEALRRVARRALETYGYRVIVAEDGEAALRALEDAGNEVDLVFTDLVMPKMGGVALYTEATRRVGSLKFLVASGYGITDAREREGLPPDVPFVKKPWTIDELLDGVRRALDTPPPDQSDP